MRKACGLCVEVRTHLELLQQQFPHHLSEIDIDSDPVLQRTFFDQIPVVQVGAYTLKAPITRQDLVAILAAVIDNRSQSRQKGAARKGDPIGKTMASEGSDRTYSWISRHYLALLNLIVFLYVGLPFLAPTLLKFNSPTAARFIYSIYSPLCHQFGFRSFFLWGQQPYYPLKEAGLTSLKTFDQITGYSNLGDPYSASRLSARQYTGDPTVGYKVALCERDVAIYGAILVFGLIYSLSGRRLPGLHWMLWFVFALGPIGLDGFSQILSQFNWAWLIQYLPYRESTPFLRVLSGFLFGFGTAWFAIPNIEESMRETRMALESKLVIPQVTH